MITMVKKEKSSSKLMPYDFKEIGESIKTARLKKGMEIHEVSRAVIVPVPVIKRIEDGDITLMSKSVDILIKYFDLPKPRFNGYTRRSMCKSVRVDNETYEIDRKSVV